VLKIFEATYLLADPNGDAPNGGADCMVPPPKPAKPPPAGDEAKEPNPPPCAIEPNPLDEPNVPPPNPPDGATPNPAVLPNPMGAGDPKVMAPVDGAADGCRALTPNIDGSRLYFLARARNICSSRPAYLFSSVSTSLTFFGLCAW
jgi:hypothetical protein